MPLNTQVNIYSIDTGAFYSNREEKLHWKICSFRKERTKVMEEMDKLEEIIASIGGINAKELENLESISSQFDEEEYCYLASLRSQYQNLESLKVHKAKLIRETKEKLLEILENKVEINEKSNGKHHVRQLNPVYIKEKNIISIFESSLTRMMGLRKNELTDSLMVVKVFYFDIIKDIILHGFEYNGEKYRFFTASAGQIRTKKTVFIKESVWEKYEKTLMCGLTIDKINEKGGNNVNKHLAYLALSNSATDLWEDFDITKTIVVDDFETNVQGTVDFIDEITYTVERKEMDVPITHTDGAGMMLPSVSSKNFMVRLPWIKGLISVFNFRSFLSSREDSSPIIRDIYGKEHDIIEEDIQIIFTKSQFKMWKYYDSWDEYITCYQMYGCTAGTCNEEEDVISDAHINYQMLQTLSDMKDNELEVIAEKSVSRLTNITSNMRTMLDAFGANTAKRNKTFLQMALSLYPTLLNDPYMKEKIREIKDSMVKNYRAGKLEVDGKFTFVIPDFYAACEYWFCGISDPVGLLKGDEVSCRMYKSVEKLDCLRSPHLYREHAVRKNVVNEETEKWFTTDAIYTSIFDLISKILQFDVDGDRLLVIADKVLVAVAERNMRDIVPLFYNMRKAGATALTSLNIYKGLKAAYTGGNIGIYSNDISKIWASDVWETGSEREQRKALDTIKILCCENNFVIDYAKTLYKPERPEHIHEQITSYTRAKLPAFFRYAKDKTDKQVEPVNNCLINRLENIVKDVRLNFKKSLFGVIETKYMMANPDIEIDPKVIEEYTKLNQQYHFKINMQDKYSNNLSYIANDIQCQLSAFGYSDQELSDMLVKYLYDIKKSKSKEALWFCYGNHIVNNLMLNLDKDMVICKKCGKLFIRSHHLQEYCDVCKEQKESKKRSNKVQRHCIDCSEMFEVVATNSTKCRCDSCQRIYRRIKKTETMRKLREL